MRSLIRLFLVLLVLGGGGYILVNFYPYIFSRKVQGEVISIERVQLNVSLIQQQGPTQNFNPELFSFAVAVKVPGGEIVTASAEDRQWAVVQKGQCVVAQFYPYPPWNLMKAGTYHNARVDHLSECPK
jgi:hypothetical protein